MAFNSKGEWVPEDDSVTKQVNAVIADDSPYIQRARVEGTSFANRRGLLNSSMAAGASTGAAIDRALPIASQNAQQISQKNLTYQQGGYDKERQAMVTASNDRNASLSAALEANKAYLAAFGQLADNENIPAATRDAYIKHLLDTRSTGFDMIQQVYGIDLDWSGAGARSSPGGFDALQPSMPSGLNKDQRRQWLSERADLERRNSLAYGSSGGLLSQYTSLSS